MIIQNVGEQGHADISLHHADRRPAGRARGARRGRRAISGQGLHGRRHDGQGEPVGAGMRTHPGVAAQDVPHARRQGHQPRDDLDLADQGLAASSPRSGSTRRCARCTTRSASRAPRSPTNRPTGGWSMSERGDTVAVAGATGVGRRHRAGHTRRARLSRSASCACSRASAREAGSSPSRPPARSSELSADAFAGVDLVLLRRRRRVEQRVRAGRRRRRRGRDRQVERLSRRPAGAAGRARGQRRAAGAATRASSPPPTARPSRWSSP